MGGGPIAQISHEMSVCQVPRSASKPVLGVHGARSAAVRWDAAVSRALR